MDKRQTIPDGVTPQADVTLVGVIQKQATAMFSDILRKEIAKTRLEIGKQDVPLKAYGDTAKYLSTLAAGVAVRIDGVLDVVTWVTGDKTSHVRMEVAIKDIEVLDDRRSRRIA